MVAGFWGKKIGMTQIFADDKVIPVTAIDASPWFVTRVKMQDRDGYNAVQVARVKKRYVDDHFSKQWLKKPNEYFSFVKEVRFDKGDDLKGFSVGKSADLCSILSAGDKVDVSGTTKGRGFAGVVRRHGFSGGGASHGSTMGRRPGAISFMASQGRVIKGKKMPGQAGNTKCTIQKLEVVKVSENPRIVLVKGSVPGKAGSLVFVRKA